MKLNFRLLLTLMAAFVITACSNKEEVVVDDTVSTTTTDQVDPNANNAYGTGLSMEELRALGINGDPLDEKVLYFAYNSSVVDERSRVIAEAHARFLSNQNGARVTLEGNTDERGTRDYNLALGERRAQAVSELMRLRGTGNTTISTISYGEERPADPAHNEQAWALNRRVVITYN